MIMLLLSGCKSVNDTPLIDGEELYLERCSTCHSATPPENYTKQEWLGILESMQVHADLDKEDLEIIYRYLSSCVDQNGTN